MPRPHLGAFLLWGPYTFLRALLQNTDNRVRTQNEIMVSKKPKIRLFAGMYRKRIPNRGSSSLEKKVIMYDCGKISGR